MTTMRHHRPPGPQKRGARVASAIALASWSTGISPAQQEPEQDEPAAQHQEQGDLEDHERRLRRLEEENQELRDQLDSLAGDVESFELRDVIPKLGEGQHGLGPAASKVYATE